MASKWFFWNLADVGIFLINLIKMVNFVSFKVPVNFYFQLMVNWKCEEEKYRCLVILFSFYQNVFGW